MNLLKLGENVRKLRIKKELSQAELAELTSLSPNYINSNIYMELEYCVTKKRPLSMWSLF